MSQEISSVDLKEKQHQLAKSASILIALGLGTGLYMSLVAMKVIEAEFPTVLSSHLNALLGAFWLLAVGWSLPFCRLSLPQLTRMVQMIIVANYANWLITLIKAHLHVAGIQMTSNWTNNLVLIALTICVVIPALWGCYLWILGLHHSKSEIS